MPDPAMRDLLDLLGDRWVASILAALDAEIFGTSSSSGGSLRRRDA